MPPPRQAPPDEIADRLHTAAIHLLRRLRLHDRDSGLSGPRLSALSVLVFGGPITMGALAAAEQVRPPTMSRLVQALEADGLVEQVADDTDRRRRTVQATARGRRVLHEGRRRRVAALTESIADLDERARARLAAALTDLESLSRRPTK